MFVFFLLIILIGPNVLFSFYVFILAFSLDRIDFYVIPPIGPFFIFKDITGHLGILFS